ncbi:MAG: LysM peptidoglycan-binding domain-containing protein [Clostridiaceae bacterium]|jgi:nucleoid-associated protein YgaU|nr:LysM peptidoglycan-binding domain-containing protein [Clostridiaceae bacterium]
MYLYVDQYIVQPGDTLYNIAQRFFLLNYTQILRVNKDISNPDVIYPGQVINIPKMVPMNTYIVQPGDTLDDIVHSYNQEHFEIYGFNITCDEVLAYNPMIVNPNLIYPGMIIYLPEFL